VLGDMLVAQIYSRELNLVVRTLVKKGMTASTMAGHIAIAKSVVSSPIDERTSEALYPRVWNAEVIDLPIVDPEEMNTPSFSREIVTGVAAFYSEPRLRTLFTVLAGTGARICEMLGVEIDKHLSSDFRTISIEQQANGRKVSKRLKRPASKREIDLHPDIAVLIKTFVGDRKDGFLFETTTGRPLLSQFVLGKLHCALEALGYVNEQTGTHMAGMHAFRRSRDTYLRNETDCPDGLCKFWLGHARGKDMSERYDKVKRNLKLRRSKAESCGYGFDLPSAVPPVLESGPIDEAA
jgi:integrase